MRGVQLLSVRFALTLQKQRLHALLFRSSKLLMVLLGSSCPLLGPICFQNGHQPVPIRDPQKF